MNVVIWIVLILGALAVVLIGVSLWMAYRYDRTMHTFAKMLENGDHVHVPPRPDINPEGWSHHGV